MAFVTRFWRVIIAPIMAWHLQRVIRAMTQVILAYRYCAFGDAPFGVRHMRFKPGALLGHYCAYNAGSFDPPLLRIWQGIAPRHYFNNFSFHLQSRAIHLGFTKGIKANSNELNLVKAKLNSHQFILLP